MDATSVPTMKRQAASLLVIGAAPVAQVAAALDRIHTSSPDLQVHLLFAESRIAALVTRHPWIVAHWYRVPRITPEMLSAPEMACLSELRFSRITVIAGTRDLSGYLPVFRVARRLGDLPEITVHMPDGSEERYEHFAQIGREASTGMMRTRIGRKMRNLWLYRATLGRDSFLAGLRRAAGYLLLDDELDNFTYDLANRDELFAWIAASFEAPESDVRRLAAELEDDAELAASLSARLAGRGRRRRRLHYGRRLGWYVLARLSKPRLAIETGVHDGLGTAILGRALARNAAEGHPGRLLSFDVNAGCGWLVEPRLAGDHRVVIGDSRKTLPEAIANARVDFFIHDSLHTYEHETFEFECIAERAALGAVLLSDNAHAGSAMTDFCARHGLEYSYFAERARDHFYPGAGIGLARWRRASIESPDLCKSP